MSQPIEAYALRLEVKKLSNSSCLATVIVPVAIVDTIHHQALCSLQRTIQAPGFQRGSVPLSYIEQNFPLSVSNHLKEFLFNFFVLSFLYKELRHQKILITGEPRLHEVHVQAHQDATFTFEVNMFSNLDIQEWKHLPFKAPKRKKYKDLDRQVDSFLKEELEYLSKHTNPVADIGDWVNFDIKLVDHDGNPLLGDHVESFWFKMGDEEADKPLRDIFIGKKVGESFNTQHSSLQAHFSDQIDTNYNFQITITDILHNAYFCVEQFKKYFKLKTNKDIYQKLIEVFSYRNDLSQRRSMAEESLKLILSKHKFDIPNHVVLRQQKKVLDLVQSNPDYHVYRMQKDFKKRIKQLAEKQTKELLLLDQIAYLENISVSNQDTKQYLNLIKRPRTKEFIYFDPPITKLTGQEAPISAEELKQASLREKTLNHIIYHLTKA
ncbi:MAG TPA: trigger factor [Candidatus Babeliales bacterium]|nr:trigger factor [Candidatus Babeliales bacterium]